jgi:hypothetical protein
MEHANPGPASWAKFSRPFGAEGALSPNEYLATLCKRYEQEISPLSKGRATKNSPTAISLDIRSIFSWAMHSLCN